MRILLDTNAYSALMRGHAEVADMAELDAFLDNPYVSLVPVTLTTADRFARIAAALRARGRPIPTNDIWIAAHAMETGAEMLSFDEHFGAIDGLAWVALTLT